LTLTALPGVESRRRTGLLTDACSPLYGDRAEPLRDELHRIGARLSGAGASHSA